MPVSPTNRDEVAKAELELRRRQFQAVQLFRKFVPGCGKAFIARTSPSLNIRRARLITSDYDITHEDVIEGRHFDDKVDVALVADASGRIALPPFPILTARSAMDWALKLTLAGNR